MEIVSDHTAVWNVLKRLHASDDSFMFSNINDEFKIVIRNILIDPEDVGHFMNVAVLIRTSEDNILTECLDNVADAMGWEDQDKSGFVFSEYEFDRRISNEEDLKEFSDLVNKIYKTTICPCANHLIFDGGEMCYFCEFTSTQEKLSTFDCPICMEICYEIHSATMPCCRAKMHKRCDIEWYKKGNKACAMCRKDLPNKNIKTRITLENLVENIAREVVILSG
jgi:hypothetical protein